MAEAEALIHDACAAFEAAVAQWKPTFGRGFLGVTVAGKPAPEGDKRPMDRVTERSFHRPPDVQYHSSGAGPKPDHWAKNQHMEERVILYRDAVHYSINAMDTMFVRGHTVAVTSMNGLLIARYESAITSTIGLASLPRPDWPEKPKKRMFESKADYAVRMRAWFASIPERPQPTMRERADAQGALSAGYAREIARIVATDPAIKAAQQGIWGEPDDAPSLWYVARPK